MPSLLGVQTCARSEEHTSELQSLTNIVCRLLLEKKEHAHSVLAEINNTEFVNAEYVAEGLQLSFFFNDTATTEIYSLSLHDALPISVEKNTGEPAQPEATTTTTAAMDKDRKSTRLNSSHDQISYAVFCLTKKKNAANFRVKPIKLSWRSLLNCLC